MRIGLRNGTIAAQQLVMIAVDALPAYVLADIRHLPPARRRGLMVERLKTNNSRKRAIAAR